MSALNYPFRQRIAFMTWLLPLVLAVLACLDQLLTSYPGKAAIGFGLQVGVYPLLVFWALKIFTRWQQVDAQMKNLADILERQQASIVATSADAIISTDAQGKIETWNYGAELLFGYATWEARGYRFSALLGAGATAIVETNWLLATVRQEGFVRRHETTCRNKLGRTVHVELTASLLSGESGKPSGVSVILRDISGRKRRDEEIQRLSTHLTRQAAERSRDFAEKVAQLAQANERLRELDQVRSEFVSLVSHQIRAPLTNMAGAVQRMQSDCRVVNTTCSRMFVIFEQQVARLDRLVQDVLNATRIETGHIFYHFEPVSLAPLVRQVIQQVEVRSKARSIYLTDKPGLPLVYADRDRLTEVLSNLLDNADKYSPPTGPIFIELRADQSELTVSVRDTGPGIPERDLDRVFDKFYRTDGSDSQVAYGYGLGLYVCRRLVEAQGGCIWVENSTDGGAVFSFSLPVWQG